MKRELVSAFSATAVLLGGLATTALPANASATAACTTTVGSITSGGDLGTAAITASAPITAKQSVGTHLFTPGIAKAGGSWSTSVEPTGSITSGMVILNNTLYSAYYTDEPGLPPTGLSTTATGMGDYTWVETSYHKGATHWGIYGLRNDGVLYRWPDNSFAKVARYPGFSAVKTMALITQTNTYDTFLANARGGALYTIRIYADPALKPVVTKIRTSTWQTFESLVAEKCGTQSTLLTAIDKETGSAYLYAVGHANGASTVIQGLGKVPGTYKDPIYYRRTVAGAPALNGG
ncbi:hypothetical protein AB0L70_16710 [Kribbella sp. NPDC051952]|uniref:hypothetical protein n=1 Tax=Kribbella sp. NPDC051952 TaxID=3154851 RepID=UPI00342CBA0A